MKALFMTIVLAGSVLLGCQGPMGPEGPPGQTGPAGDTGADAIDGDNGDDGDDGNDGRGAWLTGPGLQLVVHDAEIAADETATVIIEITDGDGTPLDRDGIFTEGAVSVSFVLAWVDVDPLGRPRQYTAYTTRDQTSPITGVTETQAATDSGGSFAEIGLGDGMYTYTFGTLASGFDASTTHTVGIYASRDFEDERYVTNALYDFVPDDSPVLATREVVLDDNCNQCHNPLAEHGGRRRAVGLCILCHTPQSVDPDTGNTVDMKIMIHKIHRGKDLVAVQGGEPYQIIGYGQRVHDYSTVAFPGELDICETCHGGAADGDLWKLRPTRAMCGACHDGTSFVDPPPADMTLHLGGAQSDDTLCIDCHPDTGAVAGIADVHKPAVIDPSVATLAIDIMDVTNAAAGTLPELDFRVLVDGAPRNIFINPIDRIRVTVAGPTTDYETYWQVRAMGSGAAGTLTAIDAPAGEFHYVFPAGSEMPAGASGSYGFGIEARLQGGGPAHATFNPVFYADVAGGTAVPRRQIVYQAGCDSCHFALNEHGGARRNVEYCAMCHTPDNTNDERVAAVEGTTVVAEPTDFKVMIHKIHRGDDLLQDYFLGGFPPPSVTNPAGNPIDFGETRYPGDLRACWACHVAGSFDLPLPEGVLPTRIETLTCTEDPADDGDDLCGERSSVERFIPPTSAVCTACHDGVSSVAHAEIMTTMSGVESCTTCHGPGSAFDISNAHQLDP